MHATHVVQVIVRDEHGVHGRQIDAELRHVGFERRRSLEVGILPEVEKDSMLVSLD